MNFKDKRWYFNKAKEVLGAMAICALGVLFMMLLLIYGN